MERWPPVEFPPVDPARSLDLPIALRDSQLDAFAHDRKLCAERIQWARPILRQRGILPFRHSLAGEFGPVVGLDRLRGVAEKPDRLLKPDDCLAYGMLAREMETSFHRRVFSLDSFCVALIQGFRVRLLPFDFVSHHLK